MMSDPQTITFMAGIGLYVGLFLLPFVQEDAAVIAAATASLNNQGPVALIFAAVLLGLTASDVWKYWLGYFARKYHWAHRFAEHRSVMVAGNLVRSDLAKTLFTARFVPGTRIPTYVACGFFQAPYVKFCAIVVLTAFTYVALSFALFHTVGLVVGEQAKYWLPGIAVTALAAYVLWRWRKSRTGAGGR